MQMAAAAGAVVVMDAGGADGPIDEELLQLVTVLSPNETELRRLAGVDTESRDAALAAAQSLAAAHSCDVLVKRGAEGCLLVSGAQLCR